MSAIPMNVLVDALSALRLVHADRAMDAVDSETYIAVLRAKSVLGYYVEQMLAAQSATVTTEVA